MKTEHRPRSNACGNWWLCIIALAILTTTVAGTRAAEVVDYAYASALWQTAIGLIDDPNKSVVDKSGALLYNFSKGFDGIFATRVGIDLAPDTQWVLQRVQSPKIPIVITQSQVGSLAIAQNAFSVAKPERSDVVHIVVHNGGSSVLTLSPSILIESTKASRMGNNAALIDKTMTVCCALTNL